MPFNNTAGLQPTQAITSQSILLNLTDSARSAPAKQDNSAPQLAEVTSSNFCTGCHEGIRLVPLCCWSEAVKPEIVKRVSDWQKEVLAFDVPTLQQDLDLIPRKPGIYIFADASGYLYLGEAANLRLRVAKHLDHSDRKALARYLWEQGIEGLSIELHVFDPASNGRLTTHRRAYEAELIKSRKPHFNIQLA